MIDISGIDVHLVQHPPGDRDFKMISRRWTVKRCTSRLMHRHRLARDYETHAHRSEGMAHVVMIDFMARGLTGATVLNRRGS